MIAGVGVIASILGTFLVKIKNNDAKESQVQKALDMGNWASIVITLLLVISQSIICFLKQS